MPSLDSFVGEGLAPSPYRECMAECERLRAELREARREALEDAWFAARQALDAHDAAAAIRALTEEPKL